MIILLFVVFLCLLALTVPVAFAIGMTSLVILMVMGNIPLIVIVQRMFVIIDSYSLLAVPFFMLAGEFMEGGQITQKLVSFASGLVGRLRGGLGMVSVLSSMIFAGISGSAIADTTAIGSILIPSMIQKGYKKGFTACLIASAGAIGPIIPPSVLMIIYGSITNVSIASMFLGGFLPGIMVGLGLMVIVYVYSWLPGFEAMRKGESVSLGEIGRRFIRAIWALFMPVIIIGGIITGIFTATEAGAIAACYAMLVGFISGKLRISMLMSVFYKASLKTAIILIIIANAGAFGWILARLRFADTAASMLTNFTSSSLVAIVLVIFFLLILGCFMDVIAATIIFAPIIFEIGHLYGFDQIHFAVVVIATLLVGGVTPPYGILLFIGCNIAQIGIEDASRFVIPFIGMMVLVLLLLAYIPEIVLFIPNLMAKGG
mgnify:CR=1 FL=1